MSPWTIFRWPVLIGALTLLGLVAGLVSDGWGDALAVIGLGIPVVLSLKALGSRRG